MENLLLTHDNKKDTWSIQEGSYKLSSIDYKAFSKVWKEVINSSLYSNANLHYNVLLVNDGSQMMYNSLSNPSTATIVDPLAYDYCTKEVSAFVPTVPYRSVVDSLGNTRSLLLIDEPFKDAYSDCLSKNKYDLIFLSVKSVYDITLENVEALYKLLNEYGCLFIQRPSNILTDDEAELALEHYFSYLSVRVRSSSEGISHTFSVYRKMQGLI